MEVKTLKGVDGGAGVPPEPDWASLYQDELDLRMAAEAWRTIVAEMRDVQTLTAANGPAIKRLVVFHVEFERQARSVGEGGVIRDANRSKSRQIDPSWTVMKQAAEMAAQQEAELGISPRRRNIGKVNKKSKRQTAADEFLKTA